MILKNLIQIQLEYGYFLPTPKVVCNPPFPHTDTEIIARWEHRHRRKY